ncbi:MAG: hypothetical protein GKR98_05965 [Boseongicola sp.]|nr:MAG: hypothetical protein GKR98_05965 [Boseongicola sp.]
MAPADAARSTASDDTPVLELVQFRLNAGTEDDDFIEAARGTEAMLRAGGALIRRFLTKDSEGTWSDVIEWTSMEAALSAAEAVMQEPDFQPLMQMIDPETVNLSHAPILWRME